MKKRNKARVRLGGMLSNVGNGKKGKTGWQAAEVGSLLSGPERQPGLGSAGS